MCGFSCVEAIFSIPGEFTHSSLLQTSPRGNRRRLYKIFSKFIINQFEIGIVAT